MKKIYDVLLAAFLLSFMPMTYASAQWKDKASYSEGLARVQDANDKYGFIDKTGKVVIPCQWEDAGGFQEGLCQVTDANDKYGYIDKTGKLVIPCQWKDAFPFREGLAAVKDANDKYGFIDKTGKVIIPCEWRKAYWFENGRTKVYGFNNNSCWLDKKGTVISEEEIQKEKEEKFKLGKSYYIGGDYVIFFPGGDFIIPNYRARQSDMIGSYAKGKGDKFMIKDTKYYFDMKDMTITNIQKIVDGTDKTLALKSTWNDEYIFQLAEKDRIEATISDAEANKIIRERVLPYLPKNIKISFERYHDTKTLILGTYENGTYGSKEDADKKAANAEKRDIAAFKAKYGFDPSKTPLKTVIRSGRSKSVFDAWNNWRKKHDYFIVTTELTYDGGNSKKYYFYFKGSRLGSFWIRNGKLDSVSWY